MVSVNFKKRAPWYFAGFATIIVGALVIGATYFFQLPQWVYILGVVLISVGFSLFLYPLGAYGIQVTDAEEFDPYDDET